MVPLYVIWNFYRNFFKTVPDISADSQLEFNLELIICYKSLLRHCYDMCLIFKFYFLDTFLTIHNANFLAIENSSHYKFNGILFQKLFWYALRKKCSKLEMVFCYQNCSDLLWEKIVLLIEKNFWNSRLKAENLQNFWDH